MAAKENMAPTEHHVSDVESVVNRWILDYYISLALDTFRNEQYTDFCEIRDVLQSLLVRPLEANEVITKKIRAIQFLTRINDGDKLDYLFESQEPLTPLESAMSVLDNIREEMTVPPKDLERVQKSIREMLVIVCIKKKEFDRAKEVLMKYFPKGMVGKKAIFLGLVKNRSSEHPALEQVTYHQFKQEMLHFCQGLFSYSQPFLCRAADQLLVKRQEAQLKVNEGDCCSDHQRLSEDHLLSATPPAGQQNACGLKPSAVPCAVQLTRSQLKAAYTALAEELGESRTFSQLEDEVEREVKKENARGVAAVDLEGTVLPLSGSPRQGSDAVPEQEVPGSQRDSDSPMEASPADLVPAAELAQEAEPQDPPAPAQMSASPQWRSRGWPCTVARLVVDPDSQESTDFPGNGPAADGEEEPAADGEEEPAADGEEEPAADGEEEPVAERVKSGSREYSLSPTPSQTPPRRKYRKRRACKMISQTPSDSEDEVIIMDDSPEPSANKRRAPRTTTLPQNSSNPQRGSSTKRSSTNNSSFTHQRSPTPQKSSTHLRSPSPQKVSTHQRSPSPQKVSTHLRSPSPQKVSTHQRSPTPQKSSTHLRSPSPQKVSTHQRSPTPQKSSTHRGSPGPKKGSIDQRSSTPKKGSTHLRSPNPQKASTRQNETDSKWKKLINLATESKDRWSDEENLFDSPQKEGSGNDTISSGAGKRRRWTAEETEWVKDGVKRFGEGNWGKIKSTFPFVGRTSVNIKDRWRTMLKLKIV
ncbi:telomeric repeat binding factor a [Esox lucius]|uniref:Telomeric repeat-binding factor n=1 Tax=Esox lucius TaxID=8010 RepID=A0A3P9A7X8_ESOLU|nr:telomeric repeat binding factor a [Esox lucius]